MKTLAEAILTAKTKSYDTYIFKNIDSTYKIVPAYKFKSGRPTNHVYHVRYTPDKNVLSNPKNGKSKTTRRKKKPSRITK